MLSERLQELEQEGIVERTVVPDMPVRVEYALTRKGRALASAIDAIAEWAHKWMDVSEVHDNPDARPRAPRVRAHVGRNRYR